MSCQSLICVKPAAGKAVDGGDKQECYRVAPCFFGFFCRQTKQQVSALNARILFAF